MNDLDLEREIRASFRRRGTDVLDPQAVPPAREVLRRTRWRQWTTIVTAVVVAIAVVAASVAGVGALIRSSERRIPAHPSEPVEGWSQFGFGPGRTASNPLETTLTTANVSGLHQAWATDLGRDVDTSPTVVDGVVYVGSNHEYEAGLSAVDAATGQILWDVEPLAPPVTSPAVIDGIVIAGTGTGTSAFDAATGHGRWTRPGQMMLPPAIAEGVVYVASSPEVAALDPSTGEEIRSQGMVAALDPSTGEEIWSTIATGMYLSGGIAVADGIVYVGAYRELLALDASTGEVLWRRPHGTSYFSRALHGSTAPLVAEGVVYTAASGELLALDASTGADLWSYDPAGVVMPLALEDGVLFTFNLGLYNWITALDASTGEVLWRQRRAADSLSVADGVLYVNPMGAMDLYEGYPSGESGIQAWDASTGESLWTAPTGHNDLVDPEQQPEAYYFNDAPAIVDGVVYVGGDTSHELFAFHL